MMQDQRIQIAIIAFIAGVILSFIIYPKPEEETVYKFETKVETDTIYTRVVDTVYISKNKIKTEVLRDTVLVDFKPKISLFQTSIPSEYGSTHVSGEVLGEVLKMTATNDFKIPVVTNTITNTETKTIIKKAKGVYLGAGVNSLLKPSAKISYLDNKYLFEYQYQPVTKVHALGISKKLF
jgi:predicted RNase H-related nuclease YkuK (DUF458 family)